VPHMILQKVIVLIGILLMVPMAELFLEIKLQHGVRVRGLQRKFLELIHCILMLKTFVKKLLLAPYGGLAKMIMLLPLHLSIQVQELVQDKDLPWSLSLIFLCRS